MSVEKGKKVSFNYTLIVDGNTVDNSDERGPFRYTHGEGEIIPGLAKGLEGLEVGEEKEITVPPEEAYGKPNPDAFKEVPRSSLPKDIEPKTGMSLKVKGPNGNVFPVKVEDVKDETVVLNLNHPLSGKTLKFQIKVVSVE